MGRWFPYIGRGKFVNNTIDKSDAVRFEAATGWIAHYAVGTLYAALYLILVSGILDVGPSLLSALAFDVFTVIMPLFILHPGMGMDLFASRARNPSFVRVHSLSSHAIFGSGPYFASLALSTI